MNNKEGRLLVVSAPSGTGKSTVCQALANKYADVTTSISYTTREPRGEEVDGVDYHFVSDQTFEKLIGEKFFLEWAEVFGKRYGTSQEEVDKQLANGMDVLFDIDVQGGALIKNKCADALLIFLLPPSIEELVRRLKNRSTESSDDVQKRLEQASREIKSGLAYDYHVVNDTIESTVDEIDSIRLQKMSNLGRHEELIKSLISQAAQILDVTP
jgi:guanylate kinase